jgi:hypothetical protein
MTWPSRAGSPSRSRRSAPSRRSRPAEVGSSSSRAAPCGRKLGWEIYGAPVVSIDEATCFRDGLPLGAVAEEQARGEIRDAVAAQGRREGVDFVAVA